MKERLEFILKLVDQVSGPVAQIDKHWQAMTGQMQKGMRNIGYGTAGLVGSFLALERGLQPARDMTNALKGVASLDVDNDSLKQLQKTALNFSTQFGGSATEVVKSAYTIKSAMSNLTGSELSEFTYNSAVLAKATQADASTITGYMSTMYGIFNTDAERMGKAEWVQQLTGQTAAAVQMFNTNGSEMARSFSALGASAQSHGIAMTEQMAILGQLQTTMSGSEAGTKYRAFLKGVGKAQEELGLQFTDSQGRLLPMLQILEKLKGKFGDIDTVAESGMLQKAFGSDEAVALIKLLNNDTAGLADNIQRLAQINGMDRALEMAKKQVDPWEQFKAGLDSILITLGQAVLPLLNPILQGFAEFSQQVLRWSGLFPNVSSLVLKLGIGMALLLPLFSVFSIVLGFGRLLLAGWHGAMLLVAGGLKIFQGALWLVNAAMTASPITWIVLGIALLVAAIAAAIIYWDDLKAAFADLKIFDLLGGALDWLIDKLNSLPFINIDTKATVGAVQGAQEEQGSMNKAFASGASQNGSGGILGGGIGQSIKQAITNNTQQGNTNNVTVNTSQPITPAGLNQLLQLGAG